MDTRTKISTIVAALAYGNVLISQFDTGILEGHPRLQTVYQIASWIFAGAAWVNSHYFNQDFSKEAREGTKMTRLLKKKDLPEDYWEGGESDD